MTSWRRPSAWATVLSLAAFAAACSPAEEAATSSTVAAATTTVAPTTTEAAVPPTTPAPSTTSTEATTTTTAGSTTTTTEELSGNWAEVPLVVAGFGALGWWDGSDWVQVDTAGTLPVAGGEDYQVAGIGFEAITSGGPEVAVCEPLDLPGVILENDSLLGDWPGPYGVAISAPWDLHPNIFEPFEDDGTYSTIAAGLLSDRGLVVADPNIKQLFRTDLEGDGTNEILAVAESIQGGFIPQTGDYSIAFMQKVIEGEVQTAILGDTVITDPEGSFIVGYSIASVADLSGDGQMEIVLSAAYFEGLAVEVWEYVDDDIGLFKYLQAGCGS